MSEAPLEPTNVIPPSGRGGIDLSPGEGRYNFYETYNTRFIREEPEPGDTGPGYAATGAESEEDKLRRQSRRFTSFLQPPSGQPTVGTRIPRGATFRTVISQRPVLFFAWAVAMMMVSLDEWHNYHILPRPARLWYTSLTFFLLGAVSIVEIAVPIVNLVAVGFVIVLGYQYYQGIGQFGKTGAAEAQAAAQPSTGANVEGPLTPS